VLARARPRGARYDGASCRLAVAPARSLAAALASIVIGCAVPRAPSVPSAAAPAATPAAAPSASAEPPAQPKLPRSLRDLDLDPDQVRAVEAVVRDLEEELDPFAAAVDELGRSLAGAARQCKGDTPFVAMDAEAVVRAGEPARRAVVAAIQRVHAILRPEQRAKLSAKLLDEDENGRKDRDEKADAETRELGPQLGLSFAQVATVILRARALTSKYEDRSDVWRSHYRHALVAFAKPDFDMGRERFAEAPVVELFTAFTRDAFRTLVPILKGSQCEALGKLVDDTLDESKKKRLAKRREAR
jgi:Spy/CpxP family protein refolding chaperone